MKYIKEINEATRISKKKSTDLSDRVEEIWNLSNILNYMADEGLIDTKTFKAKEGLTIDDIKDNLRDQFPEVQSWKNLDWVYGVYRDLVAACKEFSEK